MMVYLFKFNLLRSNHLPIFQKNMSRIIKKDLITEVSNKTGIKCQNVAIIVESFLDGIVTHLSKGSIVALREFGTFDIRVSRRKVGRNPKEPETPIMIPDRHVVRFRPSGHLEASVGDLPVQK